MKKQGGLPSTLSGSVKIAGWQIRCGLLSATVIRRHSLWERYQPDATAENLGFVLHELHSKQLVSSPCTKAQKTEPPIPVLLLKS